MTAKKAQQTSEAALLRKAAALNYTGLGPTQFDDLVAAGLDNGGLPPPVKIRDDYYERDPETGEDKLRKCRALGWVRAELDAWLAERIKARDEKRDETTKRGGTTNDKYQTKKERPT